MCGEARALCEERCTLLTALGVVPGDELYADVEDEEEVEDIVHPRRL